MVLYELSSHKKNHKVCLKYQLPVPNYKFYHDLRSFHEYFVLPDYSAETKVCQCQVTPKGGRRRDFDLSVGHGHDIGQSK